MRSLYQGMLEQAQEFKVSLVGGDTSRGERLLISITIMGEAKEGEVVYRTGAQKGTMSSSPARWGMPPWDWRS